MIQLNFDPDSTKQTMTVEFELNGESRRFKVDLKYFDETDLWYITVSDADTGESFCRYVPLIATGRVDDLAVSLFSPFAYKRIGCLWCIPAVDQPSTENPSRYNLDEFAVYWSDNL